jgi:uncharacterized protein
MIHMNEINLASLSSTVLWAAFSVAVAFGFIGSRTNFCTMGAVSDVVNMGDTTRLRMWSLAAGVAVLGLAIMAYLGWVDPLKTIYTTPRVQWASMIVGGFMFGIGMVLASGCGSKTLFRIGGGSLKSLVVFIVLGITAFATLKGITAVVRANSVDLLSITLPKAQSLPVLLGAATPLAAMLTSVALALIFIGFGLGSADARTGNAMLGGIGIGVCVCAAWFVSGKLGYLAEDPNTLQEAFIATNSGRAEALSFVSPIAYSLDWLMFFSDKSKGLTIGIVSVLGTVLGATLSAWISHSFRWESFSNAEDMGNHLVGAVLMGVGGVTALGCTVGQGLSGISTLAVGSFLATAFIMLGAVVGVRYQTWRVENSL